MQDDMKKLIAYSSVAHGICNVRYFYFYKTRYRRKYFQMISHGLISAALFLCVGVVYDGIHSRLISSYGGLVHYLPKYSFYFWYSL